MSDLLTIQQAAASLGVSVRTLEREHADGKLALVRIRSRRMIEPDELARYKASQVVRQCPSERSGIAGKSVSALEVVSVLSGLFPREPSTRTRGTSKQGSAGRKSTLWLAASRDT